MSTNTIIDMSKAVNNLMSKYDLLRDVKFFILCGGKCGSFTLDRTFINNGYKTLHIHSTYHLWKDMLNDDKLNNNCTKIGIYNILKNYPNVRTNPIYVVDVYRTPIERKISSFFQHAESYLNKSYAELGKTNVAELIDYFNNNLLLRIENEHPLEDECEQLKHCTNFDFSKEYITYTINNITFIKLRLCSSDKWSDILSNIIKKPIKIETINETKNKVYSSLYKYFLRCYKVPKQYLNIIKNDNYFKFYNTEKEQEEYLNKWTAKSNDKQIYPLQFDTSFLYNNSCNIAKKLELYMFNGYNGAVINKTVWDTLLKDFDYEFYKLLYNDTIFMCEEATKWHYLRYGMIEGRSYCKSHFLQHNFNSKLYALQYYGLSEKSEDDIYEHFINNTFGV